MPNIHGTSWGSTPTTLGDSGGLVTWSIAPGGLNTGVFPSGPGTSVDPSFMTFDYEALTAQAFDQWSTYGDVEFMQIEDGGGDANVGDVADIRIFFGPVPGSTLGYSFFPTSAPLAGAGDILLENTTAYNTDNQLYYDLVLHEIGHSLGLEHVDQSSTSVMTPSLSQSQLQQDDVIGIRTIYGVQDNAPPVYTFASGEQNLTILNSPTGLIVNGNGQSNLITGASQAETFNGGDGFDTLNGGDGNDTLNGQDKADQLNGGEGDDSLIGGSGTDVLNGDAGNDTLNSGDEADRVRGGTGDDLIFGGWSEGVKVDGLWGDEGNDTIFGELGFDFIDGGTGNDVLDGGGQADNIYGQDGNDTLRGGQGLDRLFGGNGNDLGHGGSDNDGLFGGFGDDTMDGESGNDRLFGEVGQDVLNGSDGNDTLYGNAGFDTLTGGTGDDLLFGNFNADTFVFADGHGDDRIADFDEFNDLEKIDLSAVSAITSLADLDLGSATAGAATQVAANVVIDTGGGNSITIIGVTLGNLDSADFIF